MVIAPGTPCHPSISTPADVEKESFSVIEAPKISLPRYAQSPLRYPGSKRKILPSINKLVLEAPHENKLLIEPFAGGASVALGLIELGSIERAYINDANKMIWSFWKVATEDTDWLIKAMYKEQVSLQRWDYWKKTEPRGKRNLALKCLFLNRTTFSGILTDGAGPIGGRAQGKYKIGCRFNKRAIEQKLEHLNVLHNDGKIIVSSHNFGWKEAIDEALQLDVLGTPLLYLDPPYVEKASSIYRQSFTELHHIQLANYLADSPHGWILSYDDEPLIQELYGEKSGINRYKVPHTYSMAGTRKTDAPGREIILANYQCPTA